MKKFIFSLIAGAVLIGVGAGVLFMEIADFTMVDYLPYVLEEKPKTFTFEDNTIFAENPDKNISINIYLGDYFRYNGSCQIVEDKSVDGVEFYVKYYGQKPYFSFSDQWYEESDTTRYYHFYAYHETYLPKDLLEAAKYMFQEKVFVTEPDNFYVSELIIRTNHPELIKTSY